MTILEDEAAGPGMLGERISSLQISGKGLKSMSIASPWSEPTIPKSAVARKIFSYIMTFKKCHLRDACFLPLPFLFSFLFEALEGRIGWSGVMVVFFTRTTG